MVQADGSFLLNGPAKARPKKKKAKIATVSKAKATAPPKADFTFPCSRRQVGSPRSAWKRLPHPHHGGSIVRGGAEYDHPT